MDYVYRHIPEYAALGVALCLLEWIRRRNRERGWWVNAVAGVVAVWLLIGIVVGVRDGTLPMVWMRGTALAGVVITVLMAAIEGLFRTASLVSPAFDPERRRVLSIAKSAALAGPAAMVGYGTFIGRYQWRLQEVNVGVKGLAKDLDGLRLVQLTDFHYSPYFTAADLEYSIDMANETRAHLALMTGDLITTRLDPLDDCIRRLARVKAEAGMLGCLGNHEVFAGCERYVQQQGARTGMRILRNHTETVRFGSSGICFTGVDYQPFRQPYLTEIKGLHKPGMLNVLLSHNPDVFPVAARLGYDLTVAGHTHGGQVTVEILRQYANVARFFTPYVSGLYEKDGKSVYVSRGLGTVGLPARVGAPPEVTLIRLCAT